MIKQNAILAATMMTVLDRNRNLIDLLVPFVQYSIAEKVNLGEKVDASVLSTYLKDKFQYKIFPEAMVKEVLNRICKKTEYIKRCNREYTYSMDLQPEYEKFISIKETSQKQIDCVVDGLLAYLETKMIKVPTREDAIDRLFYFLEHYGMLESYSFNYNACENVLYQIGKFVLDEQQKQSNVFDCFVELVKGQLISRAVYLQYYTTTPRESKMQKCKIFLDTTLILNILGLKTEAQNNVSCEFLSLLPRDCELLYFRHTLDEVRSAIRKYMYEIQGEQPGTGRTLEGFAGATLSEVETYYKQIEHILSKKNIKEWQNNLPNIRVEEIFDEVSLREAMDINMKYNSDIAKQNDIDAAAFIKRIRRGKVARHIEDSNAFFVTNNTTLAKLTKQHACKFEEISFVITEQDFTVAMWLKSSMQNTNIPRSILVSNAMAAIGRVSDSFIDEIKNKVEKYIKGGIFTDDDSIQLMIEDKSIQQELLDETFGNTDSVSPELLKEKDTAYRNRIVEEVKTKEINAINSRMKESIKENTQLIDGIKRKAQLKADASRKRLKIMLTLLYILTAFSLFCVGLYFTINNLVNDNLHGIGFIIPVLLGAFGFIDLLMKPKRFLMKFIAVVANRVRDKVYDKETEVLADTRVC